MAQRGIGVLKEGPLSALDIVRIAGIIGGAIGVSCIAVMRVRRERWACSSSAEYQWRVPSRGPPSIHPKGLL